MEKETLIPLVRLLQSAFDASHEWVDVNVECDGPVHADMCGCNALISLSKYEVAEKRFNECIRKMLKEVQQ